VSTTVTVTAILSALLGGIGLFLLGMWLMTEGLKLAAGATLKRVLASWTDSPTRALVTGAGLTATLQSSSAVTVATVGFVNAGLLTLSQAVWVIYGSNVGTTMTGWIVALTGIEIRLDAYALPAIGLGMLLRLSNPGSRRAAYGQALAGFAIFLLGIQALKTGFSSLAANVDFSTLPQNGWLAVAVYFGIGAFLTFLIQSSSATTVISISAAAAGVIPIEHAAVVIIGADLGTSSTAALSALGATANARRAAASHVVLNVVTAMFAVTMLASLVAVARGIQQLLSLPSDAGVTVAIFSTTFNVAGVLLMIPFTRAMVRVLERRFVSQEDDLARPKHFDATLLEVPELAVRGLLLELQRLGHACLDLVAETSGFVRRGSEAMQRRRAGIETLAGQVRSVIGKLNRARLSADVADDVPALLRALQHYEEIVDLALDARPLASLPSDWFAELRPRFAEATRVALQATDTSLPGFDLVRMRAALEEAGSVYEHLKARLLDAAADATVSVAIMDEHMQDIARLHRATERAAKAAERIAPHLSCETPVTDAGAPAAIQAESAGTSDE
jgi:phosphate:Na+ symporter